MVGQPSFGIEMFENLIVCQSVNLDVSEKQELVRSLRGDINSENRISVCVMTIGYLSFSLHLAVFYAKLAAAAAANYSHLTLK